MVQDWKLMKSSWCIYFLILHIFLLIHHGLKISFWWCFCQIIQILTFWSAISHSRVENVIFLRKHNLFIFLFQTKVYLCRMTRKQILMHVFLIISIFLANFVQFTLEKISKYSWHFNQVCTYWEQWIWAKKTKKFGTGIFRMTKKRRKWPEIWNCDISRIFWDFSKISKLFGKFMKK